MKITSYLDNLIPLGIGISFVMAFITSFLPDKKYSILLGVIGFCLIVFWPIYRHTKSRNLKIGVAISFLLIICATFFWISSFPEQVSLETKIDRSLFFQNINNKTESVRFFVLLKKAYTFEELGHFGALLEVIDLRQSSTTAIYIATRDLQPGSQNGQVFFLNNDKGVEAASWSENPAVDFQNLVLGPDSKARIPYILVRSDINGNGPFRTISEFNKAYVSIYLSENLVNKVSYVGFVVDDYVIFGLPINCFYIGSGSPLVDFSMKFVPSTQPLRWNELLGKEYHPGDTSNPPYRPPLQIDFDNTKYTPTKIDTFDKWDPINVPSCNLESIYPEWNP